MSCFIVEPVSRPLIGAVTVPGDKSIGHRAVMFGGLAEGAVRVTGLGAGADNARTTTAMRQLGVRAEQDGDELMVHGVGVDGLTTPDRIIDCGNSGTTMRLLCGLLAGQSFSARLAGDESLARRPMRRVIDPLSEMGAEIVGAAGAKAGEAYPPLVVTGGRTLQAIEYRLPMASAQVKSAVLLAGLYAEGVTRVIEPGSSRDHTERMLAHMGAPIRVLGGGEIELDPRGWDRVLSVDAFHVPADPSSAAFIIAAGLVAGCERVCVKDVCTNPTRTGFLDVLSAMDARVERQAMSSVGEPTADLVVSCGAGDRLRSAVVEGDLVVRSIDELPVLAVVAARSEGITEFRDAGELRVKESDRIASTCAMLRGFGVEVQERPDGFAVTGRPGEPLSAARIDAAGDHRIAMSAVVAALVADGPTRIDDVDNVATSFPSFVQVMTTLGVDIKAAQ